MTLTTRPDGTTLIEGPVVDQAALHGLLRRLGDLGLPLLSVTQVEPDERTPDGLDSENIVRDRGVVHHHLRDLDPSSARPLPPVLDDANYLLGAGTDTGVALGALLEVLLIVANVGTAVALFPVLKRQNEPLALGYVTARLVECTFIAIGIVSLLAVVTLRQDVAGAAGGDSSSLVMVGRSLVAVHDWTFLLGPGFVVGVGNGLILGWLLYRSGLVPRGMALLGLVAGPVLCAGGPPRCSASSSRTRR
jgi:uncharacterized protein DUF4386